MNRDDVIRMAREAGFDYFCATSPWMEGFERFANLIAAAEREACARVSELEDVLRDVAEDLNCDGDDPCYCGRCDSSKFNLLKRVRAAIDAARGEK